jgi:hypothetical protein
VYVYPELIGLRTQQDLFMTVFFSGDIPGTVVKLHQKRASCVIQLGRTMIAIDKEITREICEEDQKSNAESRTASRLKHERLNAYCYYCVYNYFI